jgi:hypothetical protein
MKTVSRNLPLPCLDRVNIIQCSVYVHDVCNKVCKCMLSEFQKMPCAMKTDLYFFNSYPNAVLCLQLLRVS